MRHTPALIMMPVAAIVCQVQAADYLSASEAQAVLFPQASTFTKEEVVLTKEQLKAIKKASGVRQRKAMPPIWRAERDGEFLGWFFVDDVIGKHEFITYAAAISPEGEVKGIEIMSYRETHGDEVRNAQWRKQFVGKKVDAPFRLDEDIPNISGATLSCRNITDGVKRLLVLHEMVLRE